MKYCNCIYLFVIVFLASSCSNGSNKTPDLAQTEPEVADSVTPKWESKIDSAQTDSTPKVLIVPCSNGYEYNMREGDVNPSLEKYLSLDERISIEPFPYKKMQGAGYHGVFDKKYCGSILENTDVDFLIMTQMNGGLMPWRLVGDSTATPYWGYSTRILNTATMEQFIGISGIKLPSFESIDADVKNNSLVELILDSQKEN